MKLYPHKKLIIEQSASAEGAACSPSVAIDPRLVIRGESPNRRNVQKAYSEFLAKFYWQWFCTLTFKTPPHPEAARKAFNHWINILNRKIYGCRAKKRGDSIYWALALEYHKSDVIHFHALLGDEVNLNTRFSRKDAHAIWYKLFGINRIDPIDDRIKAVTNYVSKYVVKGGEIDLSHNLADFSAQQLSGLVK